QEELVADNPGNARIHNDYGNLLLLAGREAEARSAYERAVELDPDLLSPRYNLALLLERQNDLRGAIEQLTAIVERAPTHAWAHYQLGRMAEIQGRDRTAIEHYATAFRLNTSLSFPDVNPSVIDSDLVTEALLEVPDGLRVPAESPRIYEDAARITSLLLPRLPEEAGDQETERVPTPGASGIQTPPESDQDRPSPDGKPAGKVLEPGDLESGSQVGEATPAYESHDPYFEQKKWNRQQRLRMLRESRSRGSTTPSQTGPSSRSTGQSRLRVRDDG
ncbi:MAG: tetratricopeptide repeat protein, partial [Thermoanaerobaculia bacterium]|nr:tetratricopeptide repeat protein [Thermoanaerobaculia bacterium]